MSFKHFHIENKAGKAVIQIIGSISMWKNDSESFTRTVDELIDAGILDADVYINCYGGNVYEANEIINQLKRFKGDIKITIGAIAASAGFTLVLPFKAENTFCHRNSQGMYHEIAGMIMITKMEDFDSSKKQYQDLREHVVELLAERMDMTIEEVSENMKKTTWLNSKELVKYGIVAKGNIIDLDDRTPSGTKNELKNLGVDMPSLINEAEEVDVDEILKVFDKAKKDIKKAIEKDTNQNSNHKDETEMKELAKKLGLPENATADQITAAIDALQNKAKFGEQALVNIGVSKGFKKETLEKSVANNFDGTMELVNAHEGKSAGADKDEEDEDEGKEKKPSNARPSSILEQLKNELLGEGGGASPKNKKKLEDYTPEELDKLERESPEKFEQLFKESEFGKVKNPQD